MHRVSPHLAFCQEAIGENHQPRISRALSLGSSTVPRPQKAFWEGEIYAAGSCKGLSFLLPIKESSCYFRVARRTVTQLQVGLSSLPQKAPHFLVPWLLPTRTKSQHTYCPESLLFTFCSTVRDGPPAAVPVAHCHLNIPRKITTRSSLLFRRPWWLGLYLRKNARASIEKAICCIGTTWAFGVWRHHAGSQWLGQEQMPVLPGQAMEARCSLWISSAYSLLKLKCIEKPSSGPFCKHLLT